MYKNKNKKAATSKAWRERNPRHMLFLYAKRRAQRDGVIFEITLKDVPAIPDICPVANIPIHAKVFNGKTGPCINSPTLDRVNNRKGYTPDNLRILSHKGNKWKSDMSIEDVKRLLAYMETL